MDFNFTAFNIADINLEDVASLQSSAEIDAVIAWLEEVLEVLHRQLRERIHGLNQIMWETYYDLPDPDDYFGFDDFANYDGNSDSHPH
ncbi:hypothetical protein ACHAPX_006489 [Trichoderma viride]